jgi:hypothetical protein
VHPEQPGAERKWPVAQYQPRHVDRQKSAAQRERRHPEREEGDGEGERRVEPAAGEVEPREQEAPAVPDPQPDHAAHHQMQRDLARDGEKRQVLGVEQVLGERGGQDDGHRVVGARLDLERESDPSLQVETAPAQHREHRGRVGGGHHGADQERLAPIEAEEPSGRGHQAGDEHHAERGQQPGRRPDLSHGADGRAESAVEQDERERDDAEPEREAVVLEGDAAEPLGAGHDPDQQEEKGDGHPGPLRGAAEHHTHREQ